MKMNDDKGGLPGFSAGPLVSRLCAGLLVLLAATAVLATPAHSPWPGGIAVLRFYGDARPLVMVGDTPALVVRAADGWNALVGVPLEQEAPGSLTASVAMPGKAPYEVIIDIHANSYHLVRATGWWDRRIHPPS
jgi:hypothetical protein